MQRTRGERSSLAPADLTAHELQTQASPLFQSAPGAWYVESQQMEKETYSSCVQLPNVDPQTGIRDNAVPYKIMMKSGRGGLAPENKVRPCMGINGVPGGSGVIRVGDRVTVLESWSGS